jgi:hypothetical protein
MQLDIFEHSRDLMLRNDVLHALERRDAASARTAWRRLEAEIPSDDALSALDLLVSTLECPEGPPFADPAEAAQALQRMQRDIEPAAQRLWGAQAGAAWLAPLWRQLAQRAARLGFRAGAAEAHAAALWLKAGDFAAAANAVQQIESWRRIPAPLAWMSEARFRLDGLDPCWGLLAELAWLAPQRFDALTRRLADPVLTRLRRHFDAEFEGEGSAADLVWFPAWMLCETPALARGLGQAQPGLQSPPERAMRLLLDLLHLERQGRQRDLLAQRRNLRDLQPVLYATYMKSR